jgi:hypothetical protein
MLNDKNTGEWRNKVKSIFTESQKKFEEEVGAGLDLGADAEEDPAAEIAPVDGDSAVGDVDSAIGGEVEEEEPTVTVTASLLKALLDYCAAPEEEEVDDLDVDASVDTAPVDEVSSNPSMSAPSMTTSTGVMENEEVPPAVDAAGTDTGEAGDDALDADSTVSDVDGTDGDVSTEEIVQRLIDLSADAAGEPLDVDVLGVVFSPEAAPEGGEDLGGDLEGGNVELPATTGDQTLPPVVPPGAPVV